MIETAQAKHSTKEARIKEKPRKEVEKYKIYKKY